MNLTFVVPAQREPSGGRTYNTAVIDGLRRQGWTVHERRVAGDWPFPTPAQRAAVQAALPSSGPVVVDGLLGCCCPRELETASATTPLVLLIHLPLPADDALSTSQTQALTVTETRAVAAATAVVTTSQWSAAYVADGYGRAANVITPGSHRAPAASGSRPPRLLTLAALTPLKNHRLLLEAFAGIAELPWHATWAGPHPDPAHTDDLCRRLTSGPVADRVTVPGVLTGEALDREWAATDLLLVPSLTETFGLVITEAAARGVPAIVPAGTGAVEALTAGAPLADAPGTALDPRDPGVWAATLGEWLCHSDLRHRWRQAAFARRATMRPWRQAAHEWTLLLESTATRRQRP